MIEVDLPDGSVAEFPDGTAPDVIKGALRKRFNMPPVAGDPAMFKNASGVVAAPEMAAPEVNTAAKGNQAGVQSFPWDTSSEATDMLSFGLAKKFGAGATALIDSTASAATGGEFNPGERYNNQLEEYQAAQRQFGEQHPSRKLAGQGVGLGLGIARMPALTVMKGAGLAPKIANTVATGTTYGGISGAAQDADSLGERAENTLKGGAWGGTLAPVAIPVAKGIGAVTQALKTRIVNPSVETIKDFAQAGYKRAEQAGLVFSPEAYARAVDDITQEAGRRGIGKGDFAAITQQENPVVTALIDKMNKTKAAPAGPSLSDAEIMRRVASESKDPAAGMVAGKLRNMIDKAGKEDFIAGNVDEGLSGIAQGREGWARMSRAQVIDDAIESAKNAVGANYTTAGYQTALRQKFRAIADSDEFARWPKEEQDAILRVVRGAPAENTLREVGRWSPKGKLMGAAYAAAAIKFPWIVGPIAATTTGARLASQRMGANAAREAERLVKGGRVEKPDTKNLEAVIRALLAVQAGRAGGQIAGQ